MSDLADTDERTDWLIALERSSHKNWWVTFALSLVFGGAGLDRIYLGSYGLGFLKFLTVGGIGFWWILDLCLLLVNRMHDGNGDLVKRPFFQQTIVGNAKRLRSST